MSAKDKFHEAVKNALIKDGWTITHDPLPVQIGKVEMYVDLGAEKLIAAERNGEKIAIEIKSFARSSEITELYGALGQFLIYRRALEINEPDRVLFLAVPFPTYKTFFSLPFIEDIISLFTVKMIVYESDEEVIKKWIN